MNGKTECSEKVMERVVNEYGIAVLRVCFCYLKDKGRAEDAVQDVFFKIWQAWPGFDNETSEKAWIMRVTVNRCHDILRSGWLRKVTLVDRAPEYTDEQTVSEEGALFHEIQELKPVYREVVILYYYQQLTIHQIAQIQHISDSTVYTRLYRARQTLESALQKVSCEEW